MSNKEISDENVEKRCARGVNLRYQREREKFFRDLRSHSLLLFDLA